MAHRLVFQEAPDGTIYVNSVDDVDNEVAVDPELKFAVGVIIDSSNRPPAEVEAAEKALAILAYLGELSKNTGPSPLMPEADIIVDGFYVVFEEVFYAGIKYGQKKVRDALGM